MTRNNPIESLGTRVAVLLAGRNCPLTANSCSMVASTEGSRDQKFISEVAPAAVGVDAVLGSAERRSYVLSRGLVPVFRAGQ